MDPHERALLAAIRADPDDDDARMVYADWLLERGDPLGELIAAGLTGDDGLVYDAWRVEHRAFMARLPTWATFPELERGMVAAFEAARTVADLLEPASVAALVALAPVPIVRARPPSGDIRNVLVRADGRVAAVVACARLVAEHVVEIVALPSRRVIARARHAMPVPWRDDALRFVPYGDFNRLRFARDRDVFGYDLVAGTAAADRRVHHELAF